MNILITGSKGFVGRNLTELFLANDKYTVLTPVKSELNLASSEDVDEYFKNNRVDVIIHGPTTSMIGKSYPPETCENNLRMFFNLQRNLTPSMKMISLGSGSEYARSYWHKKIIEEYFDKHIPKDSHSYSKYLTSKYIRDADNGNLIHLRLFGVFGKYEGYLYKFISNSIVKSLLGLPIIINQNVIYDYLYITDLYKIIEYFIDHKAKNRIFNVTPTESIDLVRIASIIQEISGRNTGMQVLNDGIGVEYSGNNKRLLSEIGDFQFISHEAAIVDLYEYYNKIKDSLDVDAIKQDLFLNYAKELRGKYFIKDDKMDAVDLC